jgi:small subunit ribosomal protein S20
MPVIKSAKKKLRQDTKREFQNEKVRNSLKSLVKKAKIDKSEKAIISAVSMADKAAKNHIIHKNKAARIKSALAKLTPIKSRPKAKNPKTK